MKEQEREDLVAKRIFAYYLQIIDIKKKKGLSGSFVIDNIPQGPDISVVTLEDKYDSKGAWRDALGLESGSWHTISSTDEIKDFSHMGKNGQGMHCVSLEKVLEKASVLLSKNGIANYLSDPDGDLLNYFLETDKKWLFVVI